jgi:hypothetical protein
MVPSEYLLNIHYWSNFAQINKVSENNSIRKKLKELADKDV